MPRRELLRLTALTGGTLSAAELLAACSGKNGGSSDQAGSTEGSRTESLRSLVAGVPQLSVLAAQGQLPVGRSRFAFGLAGPTNALVERASPQVWFARSQAAKPLGPFAASWVEMKAYQATGDRSPRSELEGFYVAEVELPSAGNWLGAAMVEVASQRAAGQGSIGVRVWLDALRRPDAWCGAGVGRRRWWGLGRGAVLLLAYSLGLGVPLLVAAVGFRGAVGRFPALRARFRLLELAGGGVLVVVGVLLASGLWDGLLNQLRAWAGSANLPL